VTYAFGQQAAPSRPEPPPGRDVILFEKNFGGRPYRYVALRIPGLGWFITGKKADRCWTWPELAGFIGGDSYIVATNWAGPC
jgi:hypothetical protein